MGARKAIYRPTTDLECDVRLQRPFVVLDRVRHGDLQPPCAWSGVRLQYGLFPSAYLETERHTAREGNMLLPLPPSRTPTRPHARRMHTMCLPEDAVWLMILLVPAVSVMRVSGCLLSGRIFERPSCEAGPHHSCQSVHAWERRRCLLGCWTGQYRQTQEMRGLLTYTLHRRRPTNRRRHWHRSSRSNHLTR